MRRLSRLARKNWSASSIGSSWADQPVWSRDPLTFAAPLLSDREAIEANFEGYVAGAYKNNGIVFACVLARLMVLSEARFTYQKMNAGKPGDLFWDESLALLDTPWPNGNTGELIARMEQDVSLAGNFYAVVRGEGANRRVRRLRPDWVTIVTGIPGAMDADPFALDAQVIGYLYTPKYTARGLAPAPVLLTPQQVVHYSPIPDPQAQWRGMSWITPVVREVEADGAATKHKLKFFEHGTTANFVVKYDSKITPDQFDHFVAAYKKAHDGVDNAYKTVHLGGGADVTTVGSNLQQLDFKITQGAGETRIAAASGVGAIVAQFSEGMAGSALNAGNYGAARRRFADMTVRPWWRGAAGALSKFTTPPAGSRLWYDEAGIAFLREDAKDASEIQQLKAQTIKALVEAGYEPDTVTAAVQAEDLRLLTHTGRFSVQLQPPGTGDALVEPPPTPVEG